METDFKVIDAMTKNPIIVSPEISVQECAKMMNEKKVGSVVVMENTKLVGIVTEKDIVSKVVASGKDVKETKVQNIMCVDIVTIEPSAGLFDAINMMAELDIRHLPVSHNGEFMGFLTEKDILKIEPALFEILVDSIELREEYRKPIGKDYFEYK